MQAGRIAGGRCLSFLCCCLFDLQKKNLGFICTFRMVITILSKIMAVVLYIMLYDGAGRGGWVDIREGECGTGGRGCIYYICFRRYAETQLRYKIAIFYLQKRLSSGDRDILSSTRVTLRGNAKKPPTRCHHSVATPPSTRPPRIP
jgi:hypothetical protein